MARGFSFALYAAALCLTPFATSEFTEPVSGPNDFAQQWFVGDTINIAWKSGWSWGVGTQPEYADLFITWFDDSVENPFWEMLKANISTGEPGTFDWKVDLQESVIKKSSQYHFRLMQHTDPTVYTLKNARLPSRGFDIYPVPPSSSTSPSAVSSSTATTSSAPSTSSTKPADPQNSSSSNVGAIAGGVVGGLAALALLLGLILLLLRRVKQRRKVAAGLESKAGERPWVDEAKVGTTQGYTAMQWSGTPTELAESGRLAEGPGARPKTELEGSTPRDWH